MNKQLTKKSIGIAASAALMASLAVSGTALAGPGGNNSNKQGPQASASVTAYCTIKDEILYVDMMVVDASSGNADAVVATAYVQGEQKVNPGNKWDPLGMGSEVQIAADGKTQTVMIPLCGQFTNPLDAGAKAVNALFSVTLSQPASKEEYTSRCKDNLATELVDEANLKLEPLMLSCQQ